MESLGIAVLGCGAAALRHHVPALARVPGARVVAVADLDDRGRATAMERAPEARGYGDWRQALEDPDARAAVVCLPTALHVEAALAALDRGLHVYVEKPIATKLADADRLVEAWRASGVVGMMGFNYRFIPLYESARRILASDRLGPLLAARSTFTITPHGIPAWKATRERGGGALLDLGSHHVDLVRWLFGREVVSAFAEIRTRATEEDTALVQLELEGGPGVQCLFGFGGGLRERFEIHGEDARLVVDRSRHQDVVVEPTGDRWAPLRPLARAVGTLGHVGYILEKRRAPHRDPSHVAALTRFVDAARAGSPAEPDLEDGRHSLAILLAAERSARSGRKESVEA